MHERELTDTGTGGPPAAPAPEVTRAPSAHAAIWWRLVLGVLVAVLGTLLLVKVVGGSSGPRTTTDLTLDLAVGAGRGDGHPRVGLRRTSASDRPPCRSSLPSSRTPMTRSPRAVPPAPVSRSSCSSAPSSARSAPRSGGPSSRHCRGSGPSRRSTTSTRPRPTSPRTRRRSASTTSPTTATTSRSAPTRSRSDVLGPSGYARLMRVPRAALIVERRLDPTATYPFVDVANRVVVRQVGLSPDHLRGRQPRPGRGRARRRDEPRHRVHRRLGELPHRRRSAWPTRERPAAVCHSRGVRVADAALRIAG